MIAQCFFWSSIFFIFYAYLGYPLILIGLLPFRKKLVKKENITPPVSFIITVHNEENRIREKIENSLGQDYPNDKLEIIIASDCSTDTTDEIVKGYAALGVKLVRSHERRGKENAQKYAVDIASGEILIFSDVATRLEASGVRDIIGNFKDPQVGCVSSIDRFINKDGCISGEGVYVHYEMFLRRLESSVSSLVGLSGSFFAARREVCHPWAIDLQSDFNTLINTVKKGYRGICDPESVGYYTDVLNVKQEFKRKIRTATRGISVFMKSRAVLNPLRYGLFSFQILSHKLCRWLVPFALLLVLWSNLMLLTNSLLYLFLFLLQLIFYFLALIGLWKHSETRLLKIPLFFVMANLSIILAWYKYVKGEHFITWDPSVR